MTLEKRLGGPELGQNIVFGHCFGPFPRRIGHRFSDGLFYGSPAGTDKRLSVREPLPIRPPISGGPAGSTDGLNL
ncbi:hypothetical protein GCM10022281_06900 [Sphingomonas rosea]|uniref:Uncharacterized protein n=1 Tax=Sphingomonas rosea TaxID=335605 RepID=A0ABP7TS46_9SPHN